MQLIDNKDIIKCQDINWTDSKISLDNMFMLLSKTDGTKTLDDLARDPSVPILCFTGTLYRKIRYVVETVGSKSECAMFLMLKRLDWHKPHFLAFDMFMPLQEVTSGTVDLNAADCTKYFDQLAQIDYYKQHGLHRNICHLHSHGSMGAFWSSTDRNQQDSREDLGFMDDYRFYIVTNVQGDLQCTLVTYTPALQRLDAVLALSYSEPEHCEWLTKKDKKDLDDLIKNNVKRCSFVTGDTQNNFVVRDKQIQPVQQTTIDWFKDAVVNGNEGDEEESLTESTEALVELLGLSGKKVYPLPNEIYSDIGLPRCYEIDSICDFVFKCYAYSGVDISLNILTTTAKYAKDLIDCYSDIFYEMPSGDYKMLSKKTKAALVELSKSEEVNNVLIQQICNCIKDDLSGGISCQSQYSKI